MNYVHFPGWPGPVNPRGPGVGGVAYPALPARPTGPSHPGGPQGAGGMAPGLGQLNPALGLSPGMGQLNPTLGQQAAGVGQALPEGSPLAGLAAHGVPISYTPGGNPMVRAGMANQSLQMPPNVAGMPSMPGPPSGMFNGGMGSGGLFQPSQAVLPFDQANQVQQLKAQQYQGQPFRK